MAKANTLAIVSTVNTTSILDTLKELGTAIKASADSVGVIDEKIKVLKDNKVQTLGDTRKDTNAKFLLDHFIALGVAKTTAKNYLSDVRYAMENNAPFTFNSARAKSKDAKPAQKGKGETKSDADKMIGALLNVWKLSDAAEECLIMIETIMADGTPLIDAIAEVLREAGEDLKE